MCLRNTPNPMNAKLAIAAGLAGAMIWLGGCAGHAPAPRQAPPVFPRPPERSRAETQLLGTWENPQRGGRVAAMTFEPGGRVAFAGGLDFLNPAQWVLDPARRELRITFPQTPDEKLQIFQLYVGEGVKALDRRQKQVTYSFDEETHNLLVAGWSYTKAGGAIRQPEEEPVLK